MVKTPRKTAPKKTQRKSAVPGGRLDLDKAAARGQLEKSVGKVLMIAPQDNGTLFALNGASANFLIELEHANYAAMVSVLLAADAQGHDVAVKYPGPVSFAAPEPEFHRVKALAKGVYAVISGSSF